MNETSIDEPLAADAPAAVAAAPLTPPPVARSGAVLAAVCLLGWLVVCDAAIAPLATWARQTDWTALFVYSTMGCFLSQVSLLAAWNVWGPDVYWRRIAIGWGIACVLAGVWAVGMTVGRQVQYGVADLQDVYPVLLWPLASLVFEAPLWAMKTFLGARFVRCGNGPDRRLAISDLLLGMVVAAVALALARFGRQRMDFVTEADFWTTFAVIGAVGAGVTLVILPLVALATTRIRSGLAAFVVTALVVLTLGLLPPTVAYLTRGAPANGVWGVFGAFLMPASAAATIAAAFGVARLAGYRFQFGKTSRRQSSPTTENG